MNKFVLLILAGILTLSVESCSYISDFADARKKLETETNQPNSVKVNASANKSSAETEEDEVEVADDSPEEAQALPQIAGLIPTTNPETRVKSSIRGRQDPFSVVTLQPSIEIEVPKEKEKSKVVNRSNRIERTNLRQPNNVARTPIREPIKPTPFEPKLAQDVKITGVIEIGRRPKIIVQAPEESSSRYVEVGEYLSNGQVLVKRIDLNHFPTPLVILEQSGVEVAKAVGNSSEDAKVTSSLSNETLSSSVSWISDSP
ncbi:MAG: hypothetical protein Tsb0014_39560 [Pleurocapsa sp.]